MNRLADGARVVVRWAAPILLLILTACGGPGRPTPTALPPDRVRPRQPTPAFSESAARFNLESAATTAPAPSAAAPRHTGGSELARPQSDQLRLPMPQPPTALGILRSAAGLRSKPDGLILATLPAGTTVTATGFSRDGSWLAVFDGIGRSGWLPITRVTLFGDADLVAVDVLVDMGAMATLVAQAMAPVQLPTRSPARDPIRERDPATVIGGGAVAVRFQPDSASEILSLLAPGEFVEPLATTSDRTWLLIPVGVELGWIAADSVERPASTTTLPVLRP